MNDRTLQVDRKGADHGSGRRDDWPGPKGIAQDAWWSLKDPYGLGTALFAGGLALTPPPSVRLPLAVVAVVGLLAPVLRRRWWFWAVVGTIYLVGASNAAPWPEWDNHRFLQMYVLAALVLARVGPDPARHLRVAARLLLALVFVFATAWKVATPSFVDGSFFAHTLATDSRLAVVPEIAGLQDPGVTADNRAARRAWRDGSVDLEPVEIAISDEVRTLARTLTVATILLEGSVALAFVLPLRGRHQRWRDVILLVFVAATYPLAPVVSFGYTLIALGALQSHLPDRSRRWLYLGAFGFLVVLGQRGLLLEPFVPTV